MPCRFLTYQDARRIRLVDGRLIFETNVLRVSPVKPTKTFNVDCDVNDIDTISKNDSLWFAR